MPPAQTADVGARTRGRLRSKLSATRFDHRSFALFIDAYASTGGHFKKAAKAIGFSHETVYSHLRKYPDQLDRLKRDIEGVSLFRITELGNEQKDWRAFAWLLERTNPDKYALTEVHRVAHSGAVQHQVEMVPEAEFAHTIEKIREVQARILSEDEP